MASACAAAVATLASGAEAKFTRTTAWACHVISGTAQDTGYAMWNPSSTTGLTLLCPVADSDYFPKWNVTGVAVHVRDNHSAAVAKAMVCETNFAAAGGECSDPALSSSGGVGEYTLRPSTGGTLWRNVAPDDGAFPYVYVYIPSMQTPGNYKSNFRGIYLED